MPGFAPEAASLKILRQTEELWRQALALEPNNASAMVGLAVSLGLQPDNFPNQMDESVKEKKYVEARDLALKAIEVDPTTPTSTCPLEPMRASQRLNQGPNVRRRTRLSLNQKTHRRTIIWHFVFFMKGSPDGRSS